MYTIKRRNIFGAPLLSLGALVWLVLRDLFQEKIREAH